MRIPAASIRTHRTGPNRNGRRRGSVCRCPLPSVDFVRGRPGSLRSDFYVVSVPSVDGERFAILRPDHVPAGPLFWSSIDDWRQRFDQWLRATELLEEEGLRRRLADIGLPSGEVENQIQRARNLQAFNAQTTGDRPTSIGTQQSATGSVTEDRIERYPSSSAGLRHALRGLRSGVWHQRLRDPQLSLPALPERAARASHVGHPRLDPVIPLPAVPRLIRDEGGQRLALTTRCDCRRITPALSARADLPVVRPSSEAIKRRPARFQGGR